MGRYRYNRTVEAYRWRYNGVVTESSSILGVTETNLWRAPSEKELCQTYIVGIPRLPNRRETKVRVVA